jgi:hypothetical protein
MSLVPLGLSYLDGSLSLFFIFWGVVVSIVPEFCCGLFLQFTKMPSFMHVSLGCLLLDPVHWWCSRLTFLSLKDKVFY